MNILLVAPDFKPNTGGIAEYTHQVAAHLHASGERVLVLARETPRGSEDGALPYPVRRYPDPFGSQRKAKLGSVHRRLMGELELYRMLSAWIVDHEASLVLVNLLSAEARAARFLRWAKRVPYGLFVYGAEVTMLASGRRSRWGRVVTCPRAFGLLGADRVICISRFVQRRVEVMGVPPGRTHMASPGVVCPGSGPSSEALSTLAPGRRVVLTVGRLVERKGVDRAIEAMAQVRKQVPDAVLNIVGDGPDRLRLERIAASLDLERHVRFVGRVSDEEKAEWYRAAEVFVMPNRQLPDGDVEGFGIVFLEANAYGLPVVGGRSGGAVEAIVERETGLLVDPNDVDGIARAIAQLLTNRRLAQRMGEAGRRWAERSSWGETAASIRSGVTALVEEMR